MNGALSGHVRDGEEAGRYTGDRGGGAFRRVRNTGGHYMEGALFRGRSVAAVHDRLTCVVEIAVADRPLGADGGVVSPPPLVVVALTMLEYALELLLASVARTR